MANPDNVTICKLPLGLKGEILATISYTSLAIGGSLGNILLILVICRTPSLRTVCGVLISNLAVADLMVTSLVMPTVVIILVQGFLQQCFHNTASHVVFVIALFSESASLLILTMLSVDRCFAICYPLKHKIWVTFPTVKILLAVTWITSLVLPIMELLLPAGTAKSVYEFRYVQTMVVVVCYSAIIIGGLLSFRKVRANTRQIGSLDNNQGRNIIAADLQQRNRQVAKTVALVVVLFSLFWIPIAFFNSFPKELPNPTEEDRLLFWFATLGMANSAVNPWIYFCLQAKYHQALKVVLGYKQNKITLVQYNGAHPE